MYLRCVAHWCVVCLLCLSLHLRFQSTQVQHLRESGINPRSLLRLAVDVVKSRGHRWPTVHVVVVQWEWYISKFSCKPASTHTHTRINRAVLLTHFCCDVHFFAQGLGKRSEIKLNVRIYLII